MKSARNTRRIKQVKPVVKSIPQPKQMIPDRTKKLAVVWLGILIILLAITPPDYVQSVALIALGSVVVSV